MAGCTGRRKGNIKCFWTGQTEDPEAIDSVRATASESVDKDMSNFMTERCSECLEMDGGACHPMKLHRVRTVFPLYDDALDEETTSCKLLAEFLRTRKLSKESVQEFKFCGPRQ